MCRWQGPVHPRPDAGRHPGDQGAPREPVRVPRGSDLRNLVLADEVNRATPKTQSALLEAMQESASPSVARHTSSPAFPGHGDAEPDRDGGHLPPPRGPARPIPVQGLVPFPGTGDMVEILRRTTGHDATAHAAADGPPCWRWEVVPGRISLLEFAATLVARPSERAGTGTGAPLCPARCQPRRAGAGARRQGALTDGRPNLAADDVVALAPALRHRLVLGYEAVADGVTPDDLIGDVVAAHPFPGPVSRPEGWCCSSHR